MRRGGVCEGGYRKMCEKMVCNVWLWLRWICEGGVCEGRCRVKGVECVRIGGERCKRVW